MSKKYLKTKLHQAITFFYLSLEAGLIGLAAYTLGKNLGTAIHHTSYELGGMWCAISALVVLQSFLKEAKKAAAARIFGSFIGAVVSTVICKWWGYGYWQLIFSIMVSVYLMSLLGASNATRLGSTTAAVIVISGILHPEETAWLNALIRFLESVLGVSLAFIAVMLGEKLGIRVPKSIKE